MIAVTLASALLLSCGSSDSGIASKSASDIVIASKAAAESAKSVHLAGSFAGADLPFILDVDLVAGRGARGHFSVKGGAFEIIRTGSAVYVKGSPAFYRHIGGATAPRVLEGRWVKESATGTRVAPISYLLDIRRLMDAAMAGFGKLAKTPTRTVKEKSVVGVVDTKSRETLYVATEGKPYPVAIAKGGSGGGKVNFERWNEPVTITPPSNAIDISQLRAAH